jgi:D-arabinose 1-dehydrogenase-like Zn-dependent alcohol dehydrogenase
MSLALTDDPLTKDQNPPKEILSGVMQANVFRRPGEFGLEEKPIPAAGLGQAVIRVRLSTICGTDTISYEASTRCRQA